MNNIEIAEPPAKTPRSRKLPASPADVPIQTVAIEPAPAQVLPAARAVRTPKTVKADPVKESAAQPAIKAGWKGMNDDEPKLPKPAAPKTQDTPASTPKPKPEKSPGKTPPPAAAVATATSALPAVKAGPAGKPASTVKSKVNMAVAVEGKPSAAIAPVEPEVAVKQSRKGTSSRSENTAPPIAVTAPPIAVKAKAVGIAASGIAKEKPATVASTVAAKEKPATMAAPVAVKEKPAAAAPPAVAVKTAPTTEPATAPVSKPSSAPKAVVKKPAARPSSAKARIASVVAAAVKARAATKPQRAAAPVKAAAEKVVGPTPAKAAESAAATAPKVAASRPDVPPARPSVTRRVKQQPVQTGKQKPEPREKAVVQPMLVLESGHLWRMTGIHAVAYVRRASDACAILRTAPGQLADRAMAVYRDKQGRAIAWQVRFETARWAEVEGMLNMPHVKGREEFAEPAVL